MRGCRLLLTRDAGRREGRRDGPQGAAFAPLPPVTLEDLVPPDHFYRHLERTLDLGFVRDLVRDAYADSGRPSIDPVVFFKLQLILFFEGCAPSVN